MIGYFPRPRVFIDDASEVDADAMAEIHSDAFTRAWSPDDFVSLLSGRSITGLAARRVSAFAPRRLIGFALIRVASDEAEVLTLAVEAAQRGRGVGSRLIEEALRRLYRERVGSCFLEVDSDNAAAVALYRKQGFETVGERKSYYDRGAAPAGTALVMRLRLR